MFIIGGITIKVWMLAVIVSFVIAFVLGLKTFRVDRWRVIEKRTLKNQAVWTAILAGAIGLMVIYESGSDIIQLEQSWGMSENEAFLGMPFGAFLGAVILWGVLLGFVFLGRSIDHWLIKRRISSLQSSVELRSRSRQRERDRREDCGDSPRLNAWARTYQDAHASMVITQQR